MKILRCHMHMFAQVFAIEFHKHGVSFVNVSWLGRCTELWKRVPVDETLTFSTLLFRRIWRIFYDSGLDYEPCPSENYLVKNWITLNFSRYAYCLIKFLLEYVTFDSERQGYFETRLWCIEYYKIWSLLAVHMTKLFVHCPSTIFDLIFRLHMFF